MVAPVYVGQQNHLGVARQRWQDRSRIGQKYGMPLKLFTDAYKADLLSIRQGGSPMSDHDAFVAVQGLMGIETETGIGKGASVWGFLERASEDLKTIVHALPQMPKFLVDEFNLLTDTGEEGLSAKLAEVEQHFADGETREAIETLAWAPGVRLVPGSYVAYELAGGRPEELAEHPLFTFLDVLPIASKAGLTKNAVDAVKKMPSVEKAVRHFKNQYGLGQDAAVTMRLISETMRRARGEGPEALMIPIGGRVGGKPRMGSYMDFVQSLASEVAPQITLKESRLLYETYQLGTREAVAALPENIRAAYGHIEPVFDYIRDKATDFSELHKIGDHWFPDDPPTRAVLRAYERMKKGGYTQKGLDSYYEAERLRASTLKTAWDAHQERIGIEKELGLWDKSRLTIADGLAKLGSVFRRDPAAKIKAAAESAKKAYTDAVAAEKAGRPGKVKERVPPGPYPTDTLGPVWPGEAAWIEGKRSARVVEGTGTLEPKRRGPRTKEGSEAWSVETVRSPTGEVELVNALALEESLTRARAAFASAESAAYAPYVDQLISKEGVAAGRNFTDAPITAEERAAKLAELKASEFDLLAEVESKLEGFDKSMVADTAGMSLDDLAVRNLGEISRPATKANVATEVQRLRDNGYKEKWAGRHRDWPDEVLVEHRAPRLVASKGLPVSKGGAPLADAQRYVAKGLVEISQTVTTAFPRIDSVGAYRTGPKGSHIYRLQPVHNVGGYIVREGALTDSARVIKQHRERVEKLEALLDQMQPASPEAIAAVSKPREPYTATAGQIGGEVDRLFSAAAKTLWDAEYAVQRGKVIAMYEDAPARMANATQKSAEAVAAEAAGQKHPYRKDGGVGKAMSPKEVYAGLTNDWADHLKGLGKPEVARRAIREQKTAARLGAPTATREAAETLLYDAYDRLSKAASLDELIAVKQSLDAEVAKLRAATVAVVDEAGDVVVKADRRTRTVLDQVQKAIDSSLDDATGFDPSRVVGEMFGETVATELRTHPAPMEAIRDILERQRTVLAQQEGLAAAAQAGYLEVKSDPRIVALRAAQEKVRGLESHKDAAKARLETVQADPSQASNWFAESTAKSPAVPADQILLETVYRKLDDIQINKLRSPYMRALTELKAVAKQLEEQGVVARPPKPKVDAVEGVFRRVDATPSKAYEAARDAVAPANVSKKQSVRAATIVAKVDKQLRRAQELVREAEELVRISNDPGKAKSTLTRALTQLTRTDGASGSGKWIREAGDNPHLPRDYMESIERLRDDIRLAIGEIPTTRDMTATRSRINKLKRAQKTALTASLKQRTFMRNKNKKALHNLTDAEKHQLKWAKSRDSIPATWVPWEQELRQAMVREALMTLEDTPVRARALREVEAMRMPEAFEMAGVEKKNWARIKREVKDTVHWMMETGQWEPAYLPQRAMDRVMKRSPHRLLQTKAQTPQSFRKRGINPEPYTRDFVLAVHDWMLDHLRREGMEQVMFGDTRKVVNEAGEMVETSSPGIFQLFGETKQHLAEQYRVDIDRRVATGVKRDVAEAAVISRDWAQVDPTTWAVGEKWRAGQSIKYQRKGLGMDKPVDVLVENLYVPRAVKKTLDDFQGKGGMFPFTNLYDKAMDVFRISALALSPRFLVYNALGGFVLTQARSGPGLVTHLRQAADIVKNNQIPTGISRGTAYAPPELTRQFAPKIKLKEEMADTRFLLGLAEGSLLGDMWNKVQTVAGQSFRLNEWFDNVYRVAAYLDEVDRMGAKGASAEAANRSGLKLANKVLQDWDTMLPWERTIMRRIFPFYGWMKHIIKYTFTLPFDHPLRVGIVTNFAAAELEDRESGLPQWMNNVFFIGPTGEDSKQWSLTMTGANPFSDVVDYVAFDQREYGSGTIIGFLSQTSPLVGVLQETIGVNPITGRSNLYPEIMYDAERGRIRPVSPSIAETLPQAFVPQIRGMWGLMEMIGIETPAREIREMMTRDPDAFHARIMSAFGLPFAPRRRSIAQETVRAALARDQAASEAVNRALRTGNWDHALRYDRAYIRGQEYDVKELHRLAIQDPEFLEVILSAASR